ncbi:ABC transporter permease [Actinomyces culturomici]|uniref:ABC transporter permease n=1 Tax=Actinomyces culturomici TaxID=1926276 RepID=UPI000E20B206|nr:ABC transporter permease [Actinomyces culturomici]
MAELKDNSVAVDDLELTASTEDLTDDQIESLLKEGDYSTIIRATSDDDSTPLVSRTHLWTDGSKLFEAQSASGTWMKVLSEDVKTRVADLRSQIEDTKAQAETAQENLADAKASLSDLKEKLAALQQVVAQVKSGTVAPQQALANLPDLSSLDSLPNLDALDSAQSLAIPDTNAIDLDALDADQAITIAFNPDLTTSWVTVPGLIGLILTFIGTIVTAIGLVREREAGTLEQLAVMPLSPASIILGKIVPYLILALLDAGIITGLGIAMFHVPFRGQWWLFALVAFVFVFVVLGFGILISTVSETTGQAIQLAMMVMMPQILLSGFIFPLDSMAPGVRWIGYCLPLTWFFKAAIGIFLKAATLSQVAVPFLILCGFAVLIFGAATARMAISLRSGGATR